MPAGQRSSKHSRDSAHPVRHQKQPQPKQSMNQYEMDEYVLPRRRSPWVLVGAGGTAAILLGGLLAFKKGNQNLSQHMMRARVVAQGATVALMAGTAGVASLGASGEKAPPAPQSKRKDQPEMQSEMQ
ncbi:hypothetical protein WJX79_009251 [Trebouxia sp. C0005]